MNGFLWTFITLQVLINLYVAGIVIFWVVQKRRYGTFNPLSPFQHRDLQAARGLLTEFKEISHRAALLLHQLQFKQQTVAPATLVRVSEPTDLTPTVAPSTPSLAVQPRVSTLRGRHDQIAALLASGLSIREVAQQTGASQEEIQLVKSLN